MNRGPAASARKNLFTLVLIALFLAFMQVSTVAQAAEGTTWELWPRERSAPGGQAAPPAPAPPTEKPIVESPIAETPGAPAGTPAAAAAERTGEEAGKKADAGVKSGTIGKWALVLGGIALIAVAAGGGGGGGSTTPNH